MDAPKKRWYQKKKWIVIFLIFFFPIGLYLMWRYAKWKKIVKIVISVLLGVFWGLALLGGGSVEATVAHTNGHYTYSMPESWSEKKGDTGVKYYYPEDAMVMVSVTENADLDATDQAGQKLFIKGMKEDEDVCDFKQTSVKQYSHDDFKGFELKFTATMAKQKGEGDMYVLSYGDDLVTMGLFNYGASDYEIDLEKAVESLSGDAEAGVKDSTSEEEENDDTSSSQESSTDQSEKSSTDGSASSTVSPEVKKELDGYEAFIDEYIQFMKKYNQSSDNTALLSDYAELITKYSEWVEKIDTMNTDSMSSADLAYYTKVTSRCS